MRSSDSYLVNVLDKLEETGLFDDTLIVRTADHGEMGLAHGGLRQKNFNFYEEATRVPLVYSNPKLFPKPPQTDALVSHVDFLPTLASLAAAPKSARANWQGVDYSKLVLTRGREARPRTTSSSPTTTTSRARRTGPTRNRRTTSSASAKGAGSWPSTTTSKRQRSRRSGRCTTSKTDPLERTNLAYQRLQTHRRAGEAVPAAQTQARPGRKDPPAAALARAPIQASRAAASRTIPAIRSGSSSCG